jgi:hypothetical protein
VGWYRQILQQLLEGFQRENLTAMLTHEVTAIEPHAFALEVTEYLTDTVIVLHRDQHRRDDELHGRHGGRKPLPRILPCPGELHQTALDDDLSELREPPNSSG